MFELLAMGFSHSLVMHCASRPNPLLAYQKGLSVVRRFGEMAFELLYRKIPDISAVSRCLCLSLSVYVCVCVCL